MPFLIGGLLLVFLALIIRTGAQQGIINRLEKDLRSEILIHGDLQKNYRHLKEAYDNLKQDTMQIGTIEDKISRSDRDDEIARYFYTKGTMDSFTGYILEKDYNLDSRLFYLHQVFNGSTEILDLKNISAQELKAIVKMKEGHEMYNEETPLQLNKSATHMKIENKGSNLEFRLADNTILNINIDEVING